jgi:hypothetical protein
MACMARPPGFTSGLTVAVAVAADLEGGVLAEVHVDGIGGVAPALADVARMITVAALLHEEISAPRVAARRELAARQCPRRAAQ